MSTDSEYESLLAPALEMEPREAAGHYYIIAQNWYHLGSIKAFKAFAKHIDALLSLVRNLDHATRLDAVRTLAVAAAAPRLHRHLFDANTLELMMHVLENTQEGDVCEAALVVLNHLFTQNPQKQKAHFDRVSACLNDRASLIVIFRFAHVEPADKLVSIISNVFLALANLCADRPHIQEYSIRAGVMEKAYNLKTSHRDRVVRMNVDKYLGAIHLSDYSVDKFNQMQVHICLDMGFKARALCLAIYRLMITDRRSDALVVNRLINVVDVISQEDLTLDEDWNVVNSVAANHENLPNQQPQQPVMHPLRSEPPPSSRIAAHARQPVHSNSHPHLLQEQNHNHNHDKQHYNSNNNNDNDAQPPLPDDVRSLPPPPHSRPQFNSQGTHSVPLHHQPPESPPQPPSAHESTPPFLPQPSFIRDDDEEPEQKHEAWNLVPFQPLKHTQSWLMKDIHIAILQTNPIESDEGSNLALNAERKRLQNIFNTTHGLKIFFGVLTKDSLIRCINRGAQIVHISGHGPYAKTLKVEDNFGRCEDLSADKIRDAIEMREYTVNSKDKEVKKNGSGKKAGLKLVFVSTCYSQQVAQSFCDAGVPHVVAVHSMVQILDEMATKFASAFYEALICQQRSVEDAFTNSRKELLLEEDADCCCRHEGHSADCRCPVCKHYRCCNRHHGPQAACTLRSAHEQTVCCQPNVPHNHSDKFLLMPHGANHNDRILADLPPSNEPCEPIDSRPPTNLPQPNTKIIGRGQITRTLVDLLHPDNANQGDVVWIYGRPRIGLTALALQVARFFIRPWYQALFDGGVYRVNLQNCDDPNALYSYIAKAMMVGNGIFGEYSYYDPKTKQQIAYSPQVQKDLHRALSGDEITSPIETMGDDDSNPLHPEHYIILEQHKNHKDLVKCKVPPAIYAEFVAKIQYLPLEFYLDPSDPHKVLWRRIRFQYPDEEHILSSIKQHPNFQFQSMSELSNAPANSNTSFEFQKLLVIDHVAFPDGKLSQFVQKIKRLVENVKCKLLLCCHDTIEKKLHTHSFLQAVLAQRIRIHPINRVESAKLLLDQARNLYPWDFHQLQTPQTEVEMAQFHIFEWLSKSPALIQHCTTAMQRRVPFCVILKMIECEPSTWNTALDEWQEVLKLGADEMQDALAALKLLLTKTRMIQAIWSDQQPSQPLSPPNDPNL